MNPLRPPASLPIDDPAVPADQAEIQRLTAGMARLDEDAFREFHMAYFDRLLRYLAVITREEQVARDALQETFVRVARHARPFSTEEAFWSWLTVLARSAATDIVRKRNRYWRLMNSYAVNWFTRVPPPPEEGASGIPALLEKGMNALPEPDRRLLHGKYMCGMSVRALAEEHGLSEKAVESRLRRARLQLRAELVRQMSHES